VEAVGDSLLEEPANGAGDILDGRHCCVAGLHGLFIRCDASQKPKTKQRETDNDCLLQEEGGKIPRDAQSKENLPRTGLSVGREHIQRGGNWGVHKGEDSSNTNELKPVKIPC